jgi:hypothetical protein
MLVTIAMRTLNLTLWFLTPYNKKFRKTAERLVWMYNDILFFIFGTVIVWNRTQNHLPLLSKIKACASVRATDRFKMGLTPTAVMPCLFNTLHTICRTNANCFSVLFIEHTLYVQYAGRTSAAVVPCLLNTVHTVSRTNANCCFILFIEYTS